MNEQQRRCLPGTKSVSLSTSMQGSLLLVLELKSVSHDVVDFRPTINLVIVYKSPIPEVVGPLPK